MAVVCLATAAAVSAVDVSRRHRLKRLRTRQGVLRADQSAAVSSGWEAFGHNVNADAATNRNMQWLRHYYMANGANAMQNAYPGELGHLCVGDAGVTTVIGGNNNPIGNPNSYLPNPEFEPSLTRLEIDAFLQLTVPQQEWLLAAAAGFNALVVNNNNAVLPAAGGADPLQGCHQTIIDALIVAGAGHGADNRQMAMWALGQLAGADSCDLGITLATAQTYTIKFSPNGGALIAPLTLVQLRRYLALTPHQQSWLRTFRDAFHNLDPNANAANLGAPPAGYDPLNNCHPSIVNALTALGRAHQVAVTQALNGINNVDVENLTNDRKKAVWALKNVLGDGRRWQTHSCAQLNVPLDDLRELTTALNAPALWTWLDTYVALRAHHAQFQVYLTAAHGGQNFDIWHLRGWLYATERGLNGVAGHRLIGASGWTEHGRPGSQQGAWEQEMLTRRAHGGAEIYGFSTRNPFAAIDTIGHVRPRAMGGQRDPMNFVPQSHTGQAMVQVAETIGLTLAKECDVNGNGPQPRNGRYTVVFTYADDNGRRPTQAATSVDLLNNCAANDFFGGLQQNAAAPFFQWSGPTF